MIKVLRENTTNFKELENLNVYLIEKGIQLHQTVYNGILYEINGKFYNYLQEDTYPEVLPPMVEGKYVECSEMGHTYYYND